MPQTFLGKTFEYKMTPQVEGYVKKDYENIAKWEQYLAQGREGNWADQISRAKADIAYYTTGREYQQAFEDWKLGVAREIAPSLGLTEAQLVTNPELYTDPAALAKYTGKTNPEYMAFVNAAKAGTPTGTMTSEQAAQSAMARTGKQMAQIGMGEFTPEERAALGIAAAAPTTLEAQTGQQVSTSSNQPQTYTVKSGDTLSQIAKNYGVSINDITGYRSGNPNLIYPGEVLTIKPSSTIPTGSITGGQTPITLPEGTTQLNDIINQAKSILASSSALTGTTGTTAGTSEMPKWLKDYLDTIEKPTDLTGEYKRIAGEEGIEAKQTLVNNLTQQLNTITAEAQQAQLILEQQAGGRDITSTFLGRQAQEITRQAAIKVLPVQAQLAAAQGNLALAQERVNTLFKFQTDYEDRLYDYNKELRTTAFQWATNEQKNILDAQQRAEDKAFTLLRDNLNAGQNLASTALSNGYPQIAAQIMALDPKSATYTADLARLAGGIQKEEKITESEKNVSYIQKTATEFDNLMKAKGWPYVDGNIYLEKRRGYPGSQSEFDKEFSYLLSPGDKEKYGMSKSSITEKNYTATTIPSDVMNDLVDDIKQGATLQQLYSSYPDVSPSFINTTYYNNF